jgi:subtilase family serine protease
MSLRFNLTGAQQAALTQLLVDVQNPASPRYHQWLTPEQFAAQFGMAPEDLSRVTSWLQSQGFTVTSVGRGGTFVQFSGTVAQANQAFQTELHTVVLDGVQHMANVSAPSLPRSIAAVTAAVTGLNDFKLKPHVTQRIVSPEAVVSNAGAQPNYTSSTSGSHYLAPGDFYTIYDENALITGSINGSGVKIAVVGQTDVYATDLAAFRTNSGLAANAPTVVLYGTDPGYPTGSTGTPDNLDLLESTLDLEWTGAVAPSASILFVTSLDVTDGSLTQAVDNNLAPIIADSYGECEPDLGSGDLVYYNTLLEQAAAEGITIVAASGEAGATDCETASSTSATTGLAVDFPADSPFVTGVGGTEFAEGSGTYWSATNGAYAGSALSYIPETTWNDYSLGFGIAASGGGASAYFSKPSWQIGNGVPVDYSRDVPDVALNGSPYHDGYLICITGYCTSGFRNASGNLAVAGGASASSSAFAGMLALVEQKSGARIGVANNTLYALASSTYAGSVFHDITTGTNASPCTTGSTNCPTGGTIGYAAKTGYDQATGWGSVDAFNLVNDWAKVAPLTTTSGLNATYVALAGSATFATQGTSISMTATVTSAVTNTTATPTGTVVFAVDGVVLTTTAALSASGVATYSLNTTALSVGSHTVQATYTGDSNFLGSKAVFTISVIASTLPDFSLTPATATVTTKSGTIAPGVLFTVSSLNGFTGTVTLTASYPTALNANASFTLDPVTVTPSTPGSTTLTLFAYVLSTAENHAAPVRNNVQLASRRRYETGSALAIAGFLLFLLPRRRRLNGLLLAVIAVATLSLSGCFGSSNTTQPAPTPVVTPPGTYAVTVSATGTVNGAAVTHTSAVSFVVQ